MAGPMTWELAEDLGNELGCVALLTGHPDTLAKGSTESMILASAPAYQRGSFARRAFSWVQYIVCAFFWIWRWPPTTPVLIFSNPPILCWFGLALYLLRRQPYAVMVHDIYPDILVRLQGFPETHPLIRLWRLLNRCAYNQASVVMTLGEYMAGTLARQFDPGRTSAGRVEVIYPWVDTQNIRPIPKEENWFAQKYDQVGKFTVMYSGNMGLGHDIETMVEAAHLLKDDERIHFMFIGAGPKWQVVKDAVEHYALTNVTLLGWQPEEVLPYSLATADISLVSLEPGIESLVIPSKSIYALATGSLIVALASRESELISWLEKYECGVCMEPGNSEKLSYVINSISYDIQKREKQKTLTRRLCQQTFSREANVPTFLFCMESYLMVIRSRSSLG